MDPIVFISQLLLVVLASFCSAGLSKFLENALKYDGIFGWYLPWIASLLISPKEKYAEVPIQEHIDKFDDLYTYRIFVVDYCIQKHPIIKTLGACSVCFNFMSSFFITFWFWYFAFDMWLIVHPAYVLCSQYFLNLLNK